MSGHSNVQRWRVQHRLRTCAVAGSYAATERRCAAALWPTIAPLRTRRSSRSTRIKRPDRWLGSMFDRGYARI